MSGASFRPTKLSRLVRAAGLVVLLLLSAGLVVTRLKGALPGSPFGGPATYWLVGIVSAVCVGMAVAAPGFNWCERYAMVMLGLCCALFLWLPVCPPLVLHGLVLATFGVSLAGRRSRARLGRASRAEMATPIMLGRKWWAVAAVVVVALEVGAIYALLGPVIVREVQAQAVWQSSPQTGVVFAVGFVVAALGLAALYLAAGRR